MNNRLGFFDSGVGGFSVLKSVLDIYPGMSCVYLADTARVPYGTRESEEIRQIANEVIEWLKCQELTGVVVACNTTNSLAMDIIENSTNIPTFGLIESAAEIIIEKKIGVLATASTVASKSYTKEILKLWPETFVLEQPCPAFVPLIEREQVDFEHVEKVAAEYLKPLIKANVDAIVLGCSHYPLLSNSLQKLLPSNVRLIDPSIALANKLRNFLNPLDSTNQIQEPFANTRFYSTSDPRGFALRADYWLGIRPEVELVSLHRNACVF